MERMQMTKIGLLLGSLLLIGAIATGCSSTDKPSASSSAATSSSEIAMTGGPPAASGPTITISGNNFGTPLTVSPGATITIVNEDGMEHSVTSNPAFSTDVDGGEQKTFTAPDKPGEYPIICKYHSSMHGTLIVK